jgi:hypothetical protein
MTSGQHVQLKNHLYPGDGKEAVAFALCGQRAGIKRHRMFIKKIQTIPYDSCSIRTERQVKWTTSIVAPLLDEASNKQMAILKIHSHPTGYRTFSSLDDASDKQFFASAHAWTGGSYPHLSAVMIPGGEIFGRSIQPNLEKTELDAVHIVGDGLVIWYGNAKKEYRADFAQSHLQAFGADTFEKLSRLKIAVVGCSGTGSMVIEQLMRLGVGELVLVDPDIIEERNLNRIVNSKVCDADNKVHKVDMFSSAITSIGLGTKTLPIRRELSDPEVVCAVAECDVIFGCMDGITGRHLLNRLATFYTIPYFDVGVRLEANGKGGIDQIVGTVHYFQPGRSSFLSRRVFTAEQLTAEAMKKSDPQHYQEQVREKYIRGVDEKRLAVISVNMFYASLAVNDFLARLHPYRDEPNSKFASFTISLSHAIIDYHPEGPSCPSLSPHVGKGDMTPLLEMPLLGRVE